MKVLFISSGNSKRGISPIVKSQGESLKKIGIEVDFFKIVGKGMSGYFNNIRRLRLHLKNNKYDVVHAHYALTGFVAALARANPLVVSLMGSDIQVSIMKCLVSLFNKYFWHACIVKSQKMRDELSVSCDAIIPNGVDLKMFKPMDKIEALGFTGWNADEKHILFAADPRRAEKNVNLAKEAHRIVNRKDIKLHYLIDIKHSDMPYYFNASDIVILTSRWEGSPNVIKEALACNCKIISTDVGDVRERFQDNPYCFVAENNAFDFANMIERALMIEESPETRYLVKNLDEIIVAKQLKEIYQSILN